MRRLLIGHCDLDGWGSILIHLFFKDRYPELDFTNYMIVDYGWEQVKENISYVCSFSEVIMADMSAPKEVVDLIRSRGTKVTIYDHHLSSEWLKEDPESIWDKERCGTKIFWEEYALKYISRYPKIVQEFVDLVDTYDCWREDSPLWQEAKNLNSVLYSFRDYNATNEIDANRTFVLQVLRKFSVFPNWTWTEREKELINKSNERENQVYEESLSTMRVRVDKKNRLFGIITIGSKISIVCARILKDNPALDYVICINSFRGISGKLSFRTQRDDFDLNSLAGVHGHPKAAGGTVTPELANRIWTEDYVPEYEEDVPDKKDSTEAIFSLYDQSKVEV